MFEIKGMFKNVQRPFARAKYFSEGSHSLLLAEMKLLQSDDVPPRYVAEFQVVSSTSESLEEGDRVAYFFNVYGTAYKGQGKRERGALMVLLEELSGKTLNEVEASKLLEQLIAPEQFGKGMAVKASSTKAMRKDDDGKMQPVKTKGGDQIVNTSFSRTVYTKEDLKANRALLEGE